MAVGGVACALLTLAGVLFGVFVLLLLLNFCGVVSMACNIFVALFGRFVRVRVRCFGLSAFMAMTKRSHA